MKYVVSLILLIVLGDGLVCAQDHNLKATDTLQTIFDSTACGLNYTESSVLLGKKMVFNGIPYAGTEQPANFVIGGIPSNASIVKAFLWWDLTGPDLTGTVIIENPSSEVDTLEGVLLGNGGVDECWGGGAAAFRADVTDIVIGNGTYIISGLPTDSIASDSTTDVTGVTLFVIYADPLAAYIGGLTINDGFFMAKFSTVTQTMTGLSILDTSDMCTAFILVSDLQEEPGTTVKFNNGPYVGIVEEFWDFEEKSTLVLPGQLSSTFGLQVPSDCANFIAIGLYYQVNISNATPTIAQNGDTLVASIGSTYQWYHEGNILVGATDQSHIVTENGNYTVLVSYGDSCFFGSDTLYIMCVENFRPSIFNDGSDLWTSDTGAFTYQWFIDSTAIQGATSPTYYSPDIGYVYLQVIDTLGCVLYSEQLYIDSISVGIFQATGIQTINVVPNPAYDFFSIRFSENLIEDLNVTLINGRGQIVELIRCHSTIRSFKIDVSMHNRGLYFLNVVGNDWSSTSKIVLQ